MHRTTGSLGSYLRLFCCVVCLAFMHAFVGVIFQRTPNDVTSLLMVQNVVTNQFVDETRSIYRSSNAQILDHERVKQHVKTFSLHAFLRNLSYIAPLVNCDGRKHKVVALINSARANIERRRAIRESWANQYVLSDHRVCLVFAIGIHIPADPLLTVNIEREKASERDILEGNFVDHTHNNTLKSLTGFTWVSSSCSDVPYTLLADDNMFINFEVLMNTVLFNLVYYPKSFWMGHLELKRKVTRRQDSINYISYNTYSEAALPPLCSKEAGFLLSSQAILQVLETAANASLIPRIDHFLAVTLHKYNFGRMKIINNKVFSTSIADVCALRNLATTPGMFSVSSHGIHWKNLSSISFLKTCDDPDLDLVLHSKVSNDEYFGKTLKFIHSNEDACADIDNDSEESFLVALISTLPWNHQRRNAIRRTWGASRKIDNVNIRVLFVTGVTQKDNQLYNTILAVSYTHLVNYRIRRPTSKYFIPVNIYSGKYFPPYCSGGGYIISTDVIPAMYRAALKTPLLPIDDAFQGIVAKKTGVSPTMIDQFKNYGGPSDHCALSSSMTVHGFKTADQLMKVWSNYTDTTTLSCPEDY
ncbi:uncharacterized protein LOC117120159 [Anneissia japonica]|uniref:uncharacterized protein LOC117120159 n=1 Tax=Anneissia japonica TaxID=1529436 RepID=UPI0014258DB0|nr:uncharacterized protein LOC117120159 [Anneissia japonica]